MPAKLLIVDDDAYVLAYLEALFSGDGYAVSTASSGSKALEMVHANDYDVVLTDLMMEDVNGLKLLEEVRNVKPDTAVILLTAYGSLRSAISALRLGAADYVLKPADEEELRLRVRNACEKRAIKKQYDVRSRELESFVFAVSHDLAGHLVALRGFVRRLQKKEAAQTDADCRSYIEHINSSAELMERLVKAIGEFAKAGTRPTKVEKIDLGKLVDDVLQNFQSLIEEKNVDVRIAPNLPTIDGDWVSTYQLFSNLISNAIKFSREGVRPVVEVGFEDAGEFHRFLVRDNGIGVRKADRERIFEMFGRGKDREKVPGTGLGLAIVRKIVTGAGGDIWVESEENTGSTFYFTLPKSGIQPEREVSGELRAV